MNRKMVGRILDKRAIMIYFAAWLLLFTVTPGTKSTMNLLGGFSPQGSRGLNILGIIRWNLCVLPPVAVSILFMDIEMGRLRTYTMIRARNINAWFRPRSISIAVANLIYLLLFTGLIEVCERNEDYKSNGFPLFLILFFLHSFLMSMISSALCTQNDGIRMSVIFYLAVEGIMVVIGNIFPLAAAYLPPYWGMILQVKGAYNGAILYPFLIAVFSVATIVISSVFIIKCLRT